MLGLIAVKGWLREDTTGEACRETLEGLVLRWSFETNSWANSVAWASFLESFSETPFWYRCSSWIKFWHVYCFLGGSYQREHSRAADGLRVKSHVRLCCRHQRQICTAASNLCFTANQCRFTRSECCRCQSTTRIYTELRLALSIGDIWYKYPLIWDILVAFCLYRPSTSNQLWTTTSVAQGSWASPAAETFSGRRSHLSRSLWKKRPLRDVFRLI